MTIGDFLAAIFGNTPRQNEIQTMPQGPQGMQPSAGSSFGKSSAVDSRGIVATGDSVFGKTITPNFGKGGVVMATDGTEFGHPIKHYGKQTADTQPAGGAPSFGKGGRR